MVMLLVGQGTHGRGVSPYLPLNISPEMERQVERVLVLAGKPVMRRPIPAAVVLDALPAACQLDRMLCNEVSLYLERFKHDFGVTRLKTGVAAAQGDSTAFIPNRHGERVDSAWDVNLAGYFQPSDYVLLNAGVVAYDGNVTATGSVVSIGFDVAQLDIGFRDHWLSPFTDSSSLISTEAPTMPSITLSNYQPFTPLNISYEIFLAEMSEQDNIVYFNASTAGNPRLSGLQLAMEPVSGYAVAINRLMQYGGGARNSGAVSQFFDALVKNKNLPDAAGQSQEFGNQVASLTGSLLVPGRVPFAFRVEYAGDDNAFKGHYYLGAVNLTLGIDFPKLWDAYDFTYEVSEWQNSWYVHHLYPGGLTNDGRVIGHWFGDNRKVGHAIGGQSHSLRAGWTINARDRLQVRYRTLAYDADWEGASPSQVAYRRLQEVGVNLGTSWRGFPIDAELYVGRDVFGEFFTRLGGSIDWAGTPTRFAIESESEERDYSDADIFVDLGVNRGSAYKIMLDNGGNVSTDPKFSHHVGVGARRRLSAHNDIGMRLELDRIDDYSMLSVRAVDYRFRFNRKWALGAFFGASRYDINLPAYGYYWGAGLQFLDLFPRWDIGFDMRHQEKLTRDKVLPSDPPVTTQLPRMVFDANSFSLYLSKRW